MADGVTAKRKRDDAEDVAECVPKRIVLDEEGHSEGACQDECANTNSAPPVSEPFSPPQTKCSHFLLAKSGGKRGYVLTHFSPCQAQLVAEKMGGQPPLQPCYQDGSPIQASTPNGSRLKRSMHTRGIHLYDSAATSPKKCSYTPTSSMQAPRFAPLERLSGLIVLDKKRLEKFLGVRQGWQTTQQGVMGMSAAEAARYAGVEVQGEFHWLHLFAFSMGGQDGREPNEAQNLIVGTAGANGQHLRVEDTIKNLVSRHRCIYVSYTIDPAQAVLK